ncbi:homoserine O-succinyltransferase [Domibacillus sp. 8LH]|uniref:homoserine O-acetyltransferase MetA n=1 Tax=unclassified Domibacillus TaxID=2632383 RepID=UPI0028E9F22E|nr:homoserine O-succinyltransferase [Domibacillus sp. DTU_2020_1001157_1_SI_ALB_TIR_016]WNS80257.1 homoserine O-succinyltransferase [Domibacillus sp. DTU_2020_1001157_1_SI_ALB_TIR_016]
MPINIPHQLPAREVLERENIFVMDADRARTQDIRPLNILILNLMPEKEKTEAHLLRLLGNTPLQVNVSFLYTATYESKNVSKSHLEQFYITLEEAKSRRYDGLIITGAPIELMEFEAVSYWAELQEVMNWAKTNVTSTLHICWGAQAALYHHYGIGKFELPKKCSGVYEHAITDPTVKLLRGFDDVFSAPVSRHTDVSQEAIEANDELILLASSPEAGPLLIMSKDARNIMITGHLEYDATTLAEEYERDCAKGLEIDMPENYFPGNNPASRPPNKWRSHAHLLYSNWLNYYVYQETPYEWK